MRLPAAVIRGVLWAAARSQRAMQTALCKQPASNSICIKEVTVRHAAKATDIYVLRSSCHGTRLHLPRRTTPERVCLLSDILASLLATQICCYRGRPRRNAVIHYVGLHSTQARSAFERRFDPRRLRSFRGMPPLSLGAVISDQGLSDEILCSTFS